VFNSTEDAHTKSMSTFETHEHLQALAMRMPCRRTALVKPCA
jgi:hypothetical protein